MPCSQAHVNDTHKQKLTKACCLAVAPRAHLHVADAPAAGAIRRDGRDGHAQPLDALHCGVAVRQQLVLGSGQRALLQVQMQVPSQDPTSSVLGTMVARGMIACTRLQTRTDL